MATLQEVIGQETYDLLYTYYDNDGELIEDMEDVFYCDDDDIPQDRIPKLEVLLTPIIDAKSSLVPMEAAKLLAAWGSVKAIDYIEYCIDSRVDRLGNLEPHRLHNYDTIYEKFIEDILNYHARCADCSEKKGVEARKRIFSVMKKIIILSKEIVIDLGFKIKILEKKDWREYLLTLQECYLDFIQRPEDDLNRKWNLPALTEVLQGWEPEFFNK